MGRYVTDSKMFVDRDGDIIWYDSSKLTGHESWSTLYKLAHRTDGPAIIYNIGTPRYERSRGVRWYINGIRCYTWEQFQKDGGLSDSDMMILRLKYGEIE
jgi:hypothetical protein